MTLDAGRARQNLADFQLEPLFIEELGWDRYGGHFDVSVDGNNYRLEGVAEKRGMVAFVLADDRVPDSHIRRKIERFVARHVHEHLIIYSDTGRTAQIWQWVRREPGRPIAVREHRYRKGQSGESLIQKLDAIAFSLDEEPSLSIVDVAQRARNAFDVERITKRFYERFKAEHDQFLSFISGLETQDDREWYASVTLNRLMFIYFIQKKGFLDNDRDYLRTRLRAMQQQAGRDRFHSFYRYFLLRLFHEGLGSRERSTALDILLGEVPYLNGGLFDVHQLERAHPDIEIPDAAFERLFDFFDSYQWHLDERPVRSDNEINPDVLGYIFEKYINQKLLGAYYTRDDVTAYMVGATILPLLLDRMYTRSGGSFDSSRLGWALLAETPERYIAPVRRIGVGPEIPDDVRVAVESEDDALLSEQAPSELAAVDGELWAEYVARRREVLRLVEELETSRLTELPALISRGIDLQQLIIDLIHANTDPAVLRAAFESLTELTILDPTCGSGAFLFAALKALEPIYDECLDAMELALTHDVANETDDGAFFRAILDDAGKHPNRRYFIEKTIMLQNLFGVDILEEAVEICKLRLFLRLVAHIETVDEVEPLPDIDLNVRPGNALVGFVNADDLRSLRERQLDLGGHLSRLLSAAADTATMHKAFRSMQLAPDTVSDAELREKKAELNRALHELNDELTRYMAQDAGVDVTGDDFDIWRESHRPLHWFVEFFNAIGDGGFDVIVGNPPYVGMAGTATNAECGVGTQFNRLFADYATVGGGNLYPLVAERSLRLLKGRGCWSLIVPLSVTFGGKFTALRRLLDEDSAELWYSSFDNIPDRIFTGTKESDNTSSANQQRVTIVVGHRQRLGSIDAKSKERTLRRWSTPIMRWRSRERERLFVDLPYVDASDFAKPVAWPKVGDDGFSLDLLRATEDWPRLGSLLAAGGTSTLVVPRTAGYYIAAYHDLKARSKQMQLSFKSVEARDLSSVVINSDFFFWWFRVFGDSFDVTKALLESAPIPPNPARGADRLAEELRNAQDECSVFKMYRGVAVPNVNYNRRMDLLYECDRWVWSHLGGEVAWDWRALLRYKSSSWFSIETARAASWPAGYRDLAVRGTADATDQDAGISNSSPSATRGESIQPAK